LVREVEQTAPREAQVRRLQLARRAEPQALRPRALRAEQLVLLRPVPLARASVPLREPTFALEWAREEAEAGLVLPQPEQWRDPSARVRLRAQLPNWV
jgi:hypothetical protein